MTCQVVDHLKIGQSLDKPWIPWQVGGPNGKWYINFQVIGCIYISGTLNRLRIN